MINPANCPGLGTCNTLVMFSVSSILLESPLLAPTFHTSPNDHPLSSNIYDFHCALSFHFLLSLFSSSLRARFNGVGAFVPTTTLGWSFTMDHSSISGLLLFSKGVLRRSWWPCPLGCLSCLLPIALCHLCSISGRSFISKGVSSPKSGVFVVRYFFCF